MSFGTYVKGIDGLMAGATSAWLYDVNDKSAEVGADSYKLKSGDVVVFRFVSDWSNISQETLKETLDKFGTCKTEEPNGGKPEEPKTDDPKQENQKNRRRMIQNKKNQKNQRRMIQNKKTRRTKDGWFKTRKPDGTKQMMKTRTTKAREHSKSKCTIKRSHF